jgi:cytoskeletal protein RodZ
VYNPSGPTELLHTPSQPMPTASIPQSARPIGQPSGQLPIPGQTLPPAYGGEAASRVTASGRTAQPTGPVAAPPPTPTAASTSGSLPVDAPSASVAAPTATTPGTIPPAAAATKTAKPGKPPKPAGQKKTNDIAIVALAGIAILLLGTLAFLWIRSHRPQPVAQTVEATPTPVATPTPEQSVTVPPPEVPLTAGTPNPTPTASTPSPTTVSTPTPAPSRPADATPSRGATPTTSTTPSPASTPGRSDARGATPRPTPTATTTPTPTPTPVAPIDTPDARGRAAATPTPTAAPEEHLAFQDVKLLSVTGKKATDQDVLMAFAGGQIMLTGKNGGSAIVAIPYKTLAHATYVHAKDPKWDATLPAPPDKLDLPGLIHTSQHWLALQTHQMYLILRLHDANWDRIVQAIESRTGVKVDRVVDK